MHSVLSRHTGASLLALVALGVAACSGGTVNPSEGGGAAGALPGTGGSGGSSGNATTGGVPGAGAGNTLGGALPGGGNGSGGSAAALGGMTSDVPPMMIPPSATVCPSKALAATPLRRLTRFEYANTVKNLLNVDSAPAADLPVDESDGFSNNAAILTVSELHAEKYVLVAEALAKAAVTNLAALTKCDAAAKGEEVCAKEFAKSFGRRAFRRPTTAADEELLMAAYAAGKTDGTYAEGIEVMIRAALQSPHFIYRLETTSPVNATATMVPLSQFEIGTRLAYLLWASAPDDALLDVAARGELATKEQVATKARDMLKDPKARIAMSEFYSQWLGANRLPYITKAVAQFPKYTNELRDAMVQELPTFIQHVLWTADHKLSTLLTANVAFVNPALASVYGVSAPAGTGLQMVTLPEAQGRSGILTQAGVLSVLAHPEQTSPVLRGKMVRAKMLCTPPPRPPDDVDITPPEIDSNTTARERLSAHLTAGKGCDGCHALMDPIGFAFENFDALGQYRTTENGKMIDVSGEVKSTTDPALQGAFMGVRGLAAKLAASEAVRDCVATQWFRYGSGRNEAGGDTCSLATLQEAFAASSGDLLEVVVALTQTEAFWNRPPIAQ